MYIYTYIHIYIYFYMGFRVKDFHTVELESSPRFL